MSGGAFKRVLLPIEFDPIEASEVVPDRAVEVGDHDWVALSPFTIQALDLANRLAAGGEVWLVHATPDFRDYATWMPPSRVNELNGGANKHSTTVLDAVARRHCPDVDLRYVIKPGRALDIILEAAQEHSVDVIIIAASARSRVHRAFLGSTADKVIRQSSCPVLVVPSGTA